MIDDDLTQHLAAGVSLVAGSVSPTGAPHASRCYGARPLAADRLMVFLDANDTTAVDNVRATGRLAVTTGDQWTFRSVQLKGRIESMADATDDERAEAVAHMERFWARVSLADNLPRNAVDRGTPTSYVACTVRVDAMFDQTPGPRAGGAIGGPR
jgi:hypothetical protein